MEAFALTHPSRGRHDNNDGYGAFPELGLFAVVDGMGGRWSGDVGAALILAALRDAYASGERSGPGLVLAIQAANCALGEKAVLDPRLFGTGACLAAVALVRSTAHVAHVGDCRVHRLRGGALERLTEDHSLLNDYRRTQPLSAEQIGAIPPNVMTRALGMSNTVEVDMRTEHVAEGDLFLLTSDGLHTSLGEAQMARLVWARPDLRAAVHALLDAALRAEARDNLTALLVKV
jgi:protein phosphatase